MKRRKVSKETRQKMRESKLVNPSRACPVEVGGVLYPTMAAAARALGVSRQAIWKRASK